MPKYEYQCPKCDRKTEMMLSINQADKVQECPFCKGNLHKLVSMPLSPKFTGTGFYETDYKGKG